MHKTFLIAIIGLSSFCGAAMADVVEIPVQQLSPAETPMPPALPAKGLKMAAVAKKFGEPQFKHKPAGDRAPKHPPITRWDYADYSVFFEHGTVIDAVVKDHPPELHHTDELKPAQ